MIDEQLEIVASLSIRQQTLGHLTQGWSIARFRRLDLPIIQKMRKRISTKEKGEQRIALRGRRRSGRQADGAEQLQGNHACGADSLLVASGLQNGGRMRGGEIFQYAKPFLQFIPERVKKQGCRRCLYLFIIIIFSSY